MNTVIKNGEVIYQNVEVLNGAIILADTVDTNTSEYQIVKLIDGAEVGDLWDGIALTKTQKPTNKDIPESVSMVQAREALIRTGIMPIQIDTIIASLPSPDKELAQNQFEYSTVVKRHNSWVSKIAPMIPLTEAELDDLFVLADTL